MARLFVFDVCSFALLYGVAGLGYVRSVVVFEMSDDRCVYSELCGTVTEVDPCRLNGVWLTHSCDLVGNLTESVDFVSRVFDLARLRDRGFRNCKGILLYPLCWTVNWC